MTRILDNLAYEHNVVLVIAAIIVCLFSSLTASLILTRARNTTGAARFIWIAPDGIVAGTGMWATHLIALLALEPSVSITFEMPFAIASLGTAVLLSSAAFYLIADVDRPFEKVAGGLVLGLAIISMHRIAMLGLDVEGDIAWSTSNIIVSAVLGMSLAVASVWLHSPSDKVSRQMLASAALALAIVAVYVVGIGALVLTPGNAPSNNVDGLAESMLGGVIAAASIIVTQGALAALILDRRLSSIKETQLFWQTEHQALLVGMSETAGIGAWSFDYLSRKMTWSPEAIKILGDEFITDSHIDEQIHFLTPDSQTQIYEAVEQAYQTGEGFDTELGLEPRAGRPVWIRVSCKPIKRGDQTIKLIGAIQDITREYAEREKLGKAVKDADRANQLKSQFIANMSHEIRTPLNGVLGMAQLLERTDLNDKQKKYVSTIRSSGDALLAIISDVLDLSKIESGLLALDEVPFDLDFTLKHAAEAVTGVASRKNLSVEWSRNFDGPARYLGDEKRIRQVLINLAGNAAKFTEQGYVRLTADLSETGELLLQVADSGPGIETEKQDMIFERFQQADGSATRRHDGTGLGLSISKDLVELMNGKIGVRSVIGEGSTFWVSLPLKSAEETPAESVATLKTVPREAAVENVEKLDNTDTQAPNGGLTVLLAEDNPSNIQMISEVLRLIDGVRLTVVENGEEALQKLHCEKFDLLLLDIQMPVVSGEDVMKYVRASDREYADIPIVVLTANALLEQKEQYIQAGADAYLAKPIIVDELIKVVKYYRDGHGATRRTA